MDVTPDPATLDDDSLRALERYTELLVAFNRSWVLAMGGRSLEDEGIAIADLGRPAPFLNSVTLVDPLLDAGDDRLRVMDRFLGDGHGTVYLWSAWPTPDLSSLGWSLEGYPPCMVRPPSPADVATPEDLEILEVDAPDDLAEWLDTVVKAYPVEPPHEEEPWFDERVVGAGTRLWLGLVDGAPVGTAAAYTSHGATEVNFVSCLPEWRGRGIGEALTWAATTSDPSATAMLLASDHGRPIYERMGYGAVSRFTLWTQARPV